MFALPNIVNLLVFRFQTNINKPILLPNHCITSGVHRPAWTNYIIFGVILSVKEANP